MPSFIDPDVRFLVNHYLDWQGIVDLRYGEGEVDVEEKRDEINMILDLADKLAQEANALALANDQEGAYLLRQQEIDQLEALSGAEQSSVVDELLQCNLLDSGSKLRLARARKIYTDRDGRDPVVYPEGLKELLQKNAEQGLMGLSAHDGADLPELLTFLKADVAGSANTLFLLCQLLTDGAVHVIERFGKDDSQRYAQLGGKTLCEYFLDGLLEGSQGAMVMTEPNAGSDLGKMTTRARLAADGSHSLISGSKNFITCPDADVMVVLAREESDYEATKGSTKGISMFMVPKRLPDGSVNSVRPERLEEKMGIHGSATAVLLFEDAVGYLIGKVGAGMKQMFEMMNLARLAVAYQALGIAQNQYWLALAYAREREQFEGRFHGPIINIPAVAELLLNMRTRLEALRALLYDAAVETEKVKAMEARGIGGGDYEAQKIRSLLLTLTSKYYAPALGERIVADGMQVHGGYGYMQKYQVERNYRDLKITDLYEGTAQIQANWVARWLLEGKYDVELGAMQQEIEANVAGLDEALQSRLQEEMSGFLAAMETLRNGANQLVQQQHIETICVAFAQLYCVYGLSKQARISARKRDVLHRYAALTFCSAVERLAAIQPLEPGVLTNFLDYTDEMLVEA